MNYIDEMNNLVASIDVKEYEGQPVVSSREVANNFEKEHRNVLRDVENIVKEGCSNLSRPLFIESKYQHPQNKQYYKEYLLTRDGFSLLVMGFTGAKALQWKLKYIEAFNKMEQYIKEQNKPSYMIDDRVKRAEKWIEEEKERQQLQLENKQQTKVIEKQSEVIGEMAPKAEYFDALVDNNLLTNIRDTAKELGIKERTFTEWLIQKNLCYRDKKRKIKPYANKMKYFELKEFTTAWGHSDTQTLITPRGKETFRLLLIKDGLIKDHNKQLELGLPVNEVTKSDFYN
jgi:Rha family phage regulatory protein